ncbi:MAG: hypothetical protein O9301_02245 [Leptospira sp.]|nr:hypothetical protein [Leptospira sp.]
MSQPKLHQKISLVPLVIVSLIGCFSQKRSDPVSYKPNLPHIYFEVEDKETHLILHGSQMNGTPVSFFWDTGSDFSFYEGVDLLEWQEFKNQDFLFSLPQKKNILPEGVFGLLGIDFFQKTCVYWENTHLYVFSSDSSFCKRPDAYLSTNLKFLETKKIRDHFFAKFEFGQRQDSWALLDTGSSLNILPNEHEAKQLGEKRVFLPGKKILIANLYESQISLFLKDRFGQKIEYKRPMYLGGISLENLDFSGDKDKEEVWVVGLEILRQRPIFWDFSRNLIGVLL